MSRETEIFFDHLVRADRPLLGAADRRLHVRERAPGPPLRHRRASAVRSSAGHVSRRPPARRARARQHPDPDVARQSHVAGAARQMGARGAAGQPAAAAAADVPDLEETSNVEGRPVPVRSPSSSPCTARARPAARATTSSIRSVSRSTTSTSPARGASRTAACRLTPGASSTTARRSTDAAGLRAALLARSDIVVSHFTEMLMAYALGRRVEYYDMPAVRSIVRDAKANDYRLSSLILGVAKSAAFRMATGEPRTRNRQRVSGRRRQ